MSSQPNSGKGSPTCLARRDRDRDGCQQLMKGQEWEEDGRHIKRAELMLEKPELFLRGWGAERPVGAAKFMVRAAESGFWLSKSY